MLISLYEEGKTYQTIADALGRTFSSVHNKIVALGSAGELKGYPRKPPITKVNLMIAKKMREDGKTWREVEMRVGHRAAALRNRLKKVDL